MTVWHSEQRGDVIRDDKNNLVAQFWTRPSPQDLALMVAAPELFDALWALRNECSGKPRTDQLLALIEQADAAIAKARGRAA